MIVLGVMFISFLWFSVIVLLNSVVICSVLICW